MSCVLVAVWWLPPWLVWCVRSQQCPVDIDVAQAGHATRVSRRQAVIKLRSDGMFYITNIGKNPFWINGKVGDRVLASQVVVDVRSRDEPS